ncbi:MAG: hypothetical protein J6S14_16150 [Clostridia bacterium]|nr:hypothetical protein [Clostridia bacterium]
MLIGQWILVGLITIISGAFIAWLFYEGDKRWGFVASAVTLILLAALVVFFHWYNTSTASGIRAVKDQQTELNNGLDREIVITAEDGREIYRYEGRCDLEMHDNYLLFEDEANNRVIIYKGVQDTLLILEK